MQRNGPLLRRVVQLMLHDDRPVEARVPGGLPERVLLLTNTQRVLCYLRDLNKSEPNLMVFRERDEFRKVAAMMFGARCEIGECALNRT